MELDPKINEWFERMGIALPSLASGVGKLSDATKDATKSATAQALAQARLIKSLEDEIKATGETAKNARRLAVALNEQIKQEEATIAQAKASQALQEELDRKREDGFKKLLGNIKGLGSSAISAATAMYESDKAFTATVPTLQLMGTAVKTVIEATGLALSGIEAFGFSLGKASEGLSKIAIAAVDITVSVAEMQLKMTQTYVDTYNKLSAVGVTFGGSLTGLAKIAAVGGLDLQAYGEFVKKNIESLSAMGGTVEQAAGRVMKMGQTALKGNDQLLVMYGGFAQVDDALAGWSKILAQSGMDMTKNQGALQAASASYLTSLKDLQELTGQSVEQLQKEQEEAQKDIAFRLKLQDLESQGADGIKKAQALRDQETLTLRLYGKQAADLFKEKVALDGRVISQTGLTYQAFFRAQDQATTGMINAAKLDEKERLKATVAVVNQSKDAITAQNKSMRGIIQLGQYAGDEITKTITAGVGESLDTKAATDSFEKGVTSVLDKSGKPLDKAGKDYAALLKAQQANKQKLDGITEANLEKMAKIATQLTDIQLNLITLFGDKLTGAVDTAIEALYKLAGKTPPATTSGGGTPGAPVAAPGRAGSQARAREQMNSVKETIFGKPGQNAGRGRGYVAGAKASGPDDPNRYAGLNLGGRGTVNGVPESIAGGKAEDQLITLAKKVQDMFPGGKFNAFNDTYHTTGGHPSGTAFDFGLGFDITGDVERGKKIAAQIKELGFRTVDDEYNFPKAGTTGGHIHAELKNGGITNGTSIAGEAGPEAVIPLPDGRTVPVKMDVGELVEKIEEMIVILKDHRDISEKTLWANG